MAWRSNDSAICGERPLCCCTDLMCWRQFEDLIPLLERKFCVYRSFSYDGERKLSKQIIEGTARYVTLPKGGIGLDVGCGSGALTIACAKRNPQGKMLGIDRWGKEYASFSLPLCEKNAAAEGVTNISFQRGNAVKLDFLDESFDAVTNSGWRIWWSTRPCSL